MSKYLLAIDPAEAAGWALFEEGIPIKYGTGRGANWHTLIEDLQKQITPSSHYNSCTAVIEQGWLTRANKGAQTLAQRRGIAQAAAEFLGFRNIVYVGASTWQNALGWRRGQDTKKWSLSYVKKRFNIDGVTHDVADALAVGAYMLDIGLDTA